jgi:hypothetical protein
MIYEQQEGNTDRRSQFNFHQFDASLHVAAFEKKSYHSNGFYLNFIPLYIF